MRRLFICYMLYASVVNVSAQEANTDSIISIEDSISIRRIGATTIEEQLINANKKITLYEKRIKELSQKEATLISLESKYSELQTHHQKLIEHTETVDKQLISCASNYLYMPFNAYYIKEFAIAAYELVSDKALYQKYIIRLNLLKHYEHHLRELLSFITDKEKKCHDPFQKDAKEFIPELKSLVCYQNYSKYEDFEDTYIGAKLVEIENRLNAQNASSRATFIDIAKEFETCLSTLEDL